MEKSRAGYYRTNLSGEMAFYTVSSAVKLLMDAGILVQATNGSRNRTFAYEEYLAILRRGTTL